MKEQFSEIVERMIDDFSDIITDNAEFEDRLANIEKQKSNMQAKFTAVYVSELSEDFINQYLGDIGGEVGTEVKQMFTDIIEQFGEEYISLILDNPELKLEAVEKDAINGFIENLFNGDNDDDNNNDKEEYTLKCPDCKTIFDVDANTVGGEPFCVECPNCGAEVDSKYIED